jgi:hypothetical protein
MVDGHPRRVWCNAQGQELIEEYRIVGMGHGTPLELIADGGLGAGGPFMLDVGISSTWHIARFWGITSSDENRLAKARPLKANGEARTASLSTAFSMPEIEVPKTPHPAMSRKNNPPSKKPNSASGIRQVIEEALRSAGLMQ